MTLKMCHMQKILSGFLKYQCKLETEMDQVLFLVKHLHSIPVENPSSMTF